MLVLTRKLGEGITIGNNVRVVVLEIKGGQVRIGIEAPQSVQVHRDEIYAKIQEENQKAASTGAIPIQAFKTFVKKLGRPTA